MKITGLIIILSFFSLQLSFSQDQINFKSINDSTYSYFVQKKWNDLILLGKEALNNNIDYFYLRMRIGIAYFEKHNYRQAIQHLEKAGNFNSGDESTMVYLYYSYVLSGRTADANIYAKLMPDELHKRLNITNKLINNVYIEGGMSTSDNLKKNKKNDVDGISNIYGEADLIKNSTYAHAGAKFILSPHLNMYIGYTYLNISKLKQIQQNEALKDWDDYNLQQDAVYINCDIHMKNGFTLTPAYHYLNVGFETIYADTNSDLAFHPVSKQTVSFNDYASSLALTKDVSYFTIGINAGLSKLNNNRQIQLGATFVYYPLGNLNLYSISSLTNWSQTPKNVIKPHPGKGPPPSLKRFIFSETIGFKLYKNSWLELSASFGEIENFSEKNAYVVFNNAGTIKHKYGAALILPLIDHFEFSIRYTYFENVLLNLQNTNQNTFISHKFINQSFIGGLKWTF